ncbi:MAG: TldD/PmbA family protein [Fibrobacteres bacterium]|nr:TldD/PmbA family protein [Fibrobacterota bacterium]
MIQKANPQTTESLSPADAIDFMCAEAKRLGADGYDAVAGESESMGLELFEGKVKSTEISNSRGIGIRLFKDKRPGFAFTEKMSREAITQTVKDAVSHTLLTDTVEMELPFPADLPRIDLQSYNPALEEVTLDQMKALGLELEAVAREADKRIDNIPYLGASRSSGMSMVRNSNGVAYSSRSNVVSAGIGVVAKQGENKKMGVYSNGGRSFSFDPKFMSNKAVERAVELLGAESIPSGSYPVVFSNRVSTSIMSMFGSPFFAEAVQKGQSRLAGKVGQQIAVPFLNVTSNPHIPGAPGSHLFDGEGVVTGPLEVIKAGVLQTYLYNLESAKKAGVKPTGSGSRGYSGKAGTGFSNYIVEKGDKNLDELLAAYPQCLYVTKLEGGSGCSAISGEISIGAQGFWYEQGKRIKPVDKITLSSNYFELLLAIRGLSREYSDSFSSVKVPDMLVESMHVAG